MSRAKTVAVNFLLNALVFYVIGRVLRGHRTGLRAGLVGGVLSAAIALLMDERIEEAVESIEDEL